MKGALSAATSRLSEAINQTLFPNVTYGYNSGGDPKEIPQLTYEDLKQFYQTYYHPSRCLFFFYGNMPLEQHLDFIAERTLNHTRKLPLLPSIPLQPRFTEPVYRELTYPIAPEEEIKGKTLIAFGWLTCHILEQQEALALNILEIVLMDTDASPLKFALLKSGLCKQASAFIDVEINEIPWGLTLKGCEAEHADALEKIVKDTLKSISQTGIPLQMIENAIHQLEFHRSEITGDHAPFGLSLFMRSALLKQHGADPAEGLMIHSLFDRLRQATLANPHYFSHLIQKYFLDNLHFIRIIMRPDPQQGEREIQHERNFLAKIKESLSSAQMQALVDQAAQLAEFQKKQEEEDVEILPKVSLTDIPPSAKDYVLIQEKVDQLTVFHHNIFTNEIVYADLIFNLPNLQEEDLAYLRLFTIILTQVGCDSRSYEENLEYMQGNTGGIGAGMSLNLQATHYHDFFPTFHLRGKALYRKAPKLFPLLHEIAATAHLDDLKRVKEIIFKHFTGMESRLNQSALKYAINLSASALNVASKVADDFYGLSYFWKIRDMVRDFDHQAPYILAKLQAIQEQVMCLNDPHLVLSCDAAMYDQLKAHGFYGLKNIETSPYQPWQGNIPISPIQPQGRLIASPVAFIGKVFPTVSYTHPDAPALNIAAFLFDNLTLHTKIREQGGAYGGGAVSNPLSGNFYFYSYRDPNIVSTFEAFEEAVQNVIQGNFDASDLEEAKLEIIQGLDSPISPGSQAEVAYGWWREGRSFEVRQAFRNQLLALTREEVISAVERIIAQNMNQGKAVVFAGKELLEKANQELKAAGKDPLLIEGI
jgi:Zn-dependent M16 (insulinase) family peptidase